MILVTYKSVAHPFPCGRFPCRPVPVQTAPRELAYRQDAGGEPGAARATPRVPPHRAAVTPTPSVPTATTVPRGRLQPAVSFGPSTTRHDLAPVSGLI